MIPRENKLVRFFLELSGVIWANMSLRSGSNAICGHMLVYTIGVRTTAFEENCPPDNCPLDDCSPDNYPREKLPPRKLPWIIAPRIICPRTIDPKIIDSGQFPQFYKYSETETAQKRKTSQEQIEYGIMKQICLCFPNR